MRGCKDVCARACRTLPGVSGCKGLPPLSLRGAERRGNPRPCRNAWQIGCCLGEFVGGYEFALSAAICHVPPQGERIATPVCALVRNDMLKTDACQRLQGRGAQGARKHAGCQRLQGRFPAVHRQCPGIVRTGGKFLHVIARSEATWQSVALRQHKTMR